jgi:hypothetical protein
MTIDPTMTELLDELKQAAEPAEEAPKKDNVELIVNKERAQDIQMRVYRGMKLGDPIAVQEFCAHFVFKDGDYLPVDEAMKILDRVSLRQLRESAKQLLQKVEVVLVPLESEQRYAAP